MATKKSGSGLTTDASHVDIEKVGYRKPPVRDGFRRNVGCRIPRIHRGLDQGGTTLSRRWWCFRHLRRLARQPNRARSGHGAGPNPLELHRLGQGQRGEWAAFTAPNTSCCRCSRRGPRRMSTMSNSASGVDTDQTSGPTRGPRPSAPMPGAGSRTTLRSSRRLWHQPDLPRC